MDESRLKKLLRAVERGDVSAGEALKALEGRSFDDIGFAKLDLHREARCGVPEAIFCQGKTVAQIRAIAGRMRGRGINLLATRASAQVHRAIARIAPDAVYCAAARTVTIKRTKHPPPPGEILILCAGTADVPVAEEARVTAEFLDNRVRALYDVGVAGLHRLLRFRHELRRASVVVVVAGMEGALASVVGGMVARPVIAVPTSVGYGASFNGLAALLTMLNSCAAGVAVVNIDNGFGAGCVASLINHTGQGHAKNPRSA
jgi:hypothetical protein